MTMVVYTYIATLEKHHLSISDSEGLQDLQLHFIKEYDAFMIAVNVLPTMAGMKVNSFTLVQAQYLVRNHNGDIYNDDGIEE